MTAENQMRQASMTTCEYFWNAIKDIDDKFGEGYAKQNPQLVGDFMKVASQDFDSMTRFSEDGIMSDTDRLALAIEDNIGTIGDLVTQLEEYNRSR